MCTISWPPYHCRISIRVHPKSHRNQMPRASFHYNALPIQDFDQPRLSLWCYHVVTSSNQLCVKRRNHHSGGWDNTLKPFSTCKPWCVFAAQSLSRYDQQLGFPLCTCQGLSAWLIGTITSKHNFILHNGTIRCNHEGFVRVCYMACLYRGRLAHAENSPQLRRWVQVP